MSTHAIFRAPEPSTSPSSTTPPAAPSARRSAPSSTRWPQQIDMPLVIDGKKVRTGNSSTR